MKLHPEFLKKNGCKEFVVLPYEEFLELQERLEDAEDVLALRRARKENAGQPGVPLEEIMKRYGMARPRKPRRRPSRTARSGRSNARRR